MFRIIRLKIKELIAKYLYNEMTLEKREVYMRSKFFHLGKNVELYTTDFGTEPYLINIEDNVCVAAGVRFITHDVSCFRMAKYLGISKCQIDKVGTITLKENCFVGAYSILMPNCEVGRNSVVAAGSVVTKKIPDGEVWGGNPAKFIMKTDTYAHKTYENCQKWPWLEKKEKMSEEELIKERQFYFFK